VLQLTVISIFGMRKRDSWKKFCETIKKDLPSTSRIHKILSREQKKELGFLYRPYERAFGTISLPRLTDFNRGCPSFRVGP